MASCDILGHGREKCFLEENIMAFCPVHYEYTQRAVPVVASIVLTFTQHVNGTTVKAKQNHRNETHAGGEYRRAEKQPLKRERYTV
jgi:hypothetical protein